MVDKFKVLVLAVFSIQDLDSLPDFFEEADLESQIFNVEGWVI